MEETAHGVARAAHGEISAKAYASRSDTPASPDQRCLLPEKPQATSGLSPAKLEIVLTECSIHRYYDTATDQFLSVDPALAQTGQPYGYANDDPLNVTDPTGLKGWYCINGQTHYYQGNKYGTTGNGTCAQVEADYFQALYVQAQVNAYLQLLNHNSSELMSFFSGLLTQGIRLANPIAGGIADGLGAVDTYLSEGGSSIHKAGAVVVSVGSGAVGGFFGALACGGSDVAGELEAGDPVCASPGLVIGSFSSGAAVVGSWIYDNVPIPGLSGW